MTTEEFKHLESWRSSKLLTDQVQAKTGPSNKLFFKYILNYILNMYFTQYYLKKKCLCLLLTGVVIFVLFSRYFTQLLSQLLVFTLPICYKCLLNS